MSFASWKTIFSYLQKKLQITLMDLTSLPLPGPPVPSLKPWKATRPAPAVLERMVTGWGPFLPRGNEIQSENTICFSAYLNSYSSVWPESPGQRGSLACTSEGTHLRVMPGRPSHPGGDKVKIYGSKGRRVPSSRAARQLPRASPAFL